MKRDKALYKRAFRADQGRTLVEKGKTITLNNEKIETRNKAKGKISTAAKLTVAAAVVYRLKGKKKLKIANLSLPMVKTAAIAATGAKVLSSAGINVANRRNVNQNKKMSAYWQYRQDIDNINNTKI